MFLPEYVRECMDTLESAGYACYAVGGCIRDACLGRTPEDYDLCTNATPDAIKALFATASWSWPVKNTALWAW